MKHTVEEVRLKNGARGLLIDVPEATVMSMQFHFRAGDRYAKSKKIQQVAHIMEHMAFGDNTKMSAEEFDAEFVKNGAYYNAYTSNFSMGYIANCADFEWQRILELQRLTVTQPKFTEAQLASEKGNVRSEMTSYVDDYSRLVWLKLQQLTGEDILTDKQALGTINNIKVSDVREHHKRTHTLNNMRFVIAGKMKGRKSQIKKIIEEFDLPQGERFDIVQDELHSANPTIIRRKDASNLTFGLSLVIKRKLDDDELEALHALNHILTGTMTSRIFGKARARGLAYSVRSQAGIEHFSSSWDFSGQVNHDTAPELFDIIVAQLKEVLGGKLSDKEIEATQSYGLGSFQMGAQTVGQVSNFYTGRYLAEDKVEDYSKVPEQIRRVTAEKMCKVAREFIEANTWAFTAVSSGEKQEIVDLGDKLATLFPEK